MLAAKFLNGNLTSGEASSLAGTTVHGFLRHLPGASNGRLYLTQNLVVCAALVLFAGFASGMTVGLLSIDPIQLKVMAEQGSEEQKKDAKKLDSLVQQHHLLLVTLLLANSIAMEALPVFLNHSVPEWAAVMLSVTAILLFGEILPQALCTGKRQFAIVRKSLPLVSVLMYTLFILAWPIAKFLDWFLGKNEQTFYARSHLKTLIRLHQKDMRGGHNSMHSNQAGSDSNSASENESALGADEVVVIEGALDMATKDVSTIMVKADDVFMIEWSTPLTTALRKELLDAGHSRVPVYCRERWNLKGLLYVKTLICIDSSQTPPVGELMLKSHSKLPIFCNSETNLYDLLNEFQRGSHMAFICDDPEWHRENWKDPDRDISPSTPPRFQGIVTLEDVIEELIQEEIYDEFDHYCSGFFTQSTKGDYASQALRTLGVPRSSPAQDTSERGSVLFTTDNFRKGAPRAANTLDVDTSIFCDLGQPLLLLESETSTVDMPQLPATSNPAASDGSVVKQRRFIVRPPPARHVSSKDHLGSWTASKIRTHQRKSANLPALNPIESGAVESPETPQQIANV